MKTYQFSYKVSIDVDFSDEELEIIRRCAVNHYDLRVKNSARQGGFLYGWLNCLGGDVAHVCCNDDELDTCAKALQYEASGETTTQAKERHNLRCMIMGVFRALNYEYTRIN